MAAVPLTLVLPSGDYEANALLNPTTAMEVMDMEEDLLDIGVVVTLTLDVPSSAIHVASVQLNPTTAIPDTDMASI